MRWATTKDRPGVTGAGANLTQQEMITSQKTTLVTGGLKVGSTYDKQYTVRR
tara:strand:- start:1925 stop:2080 length:156 start_codon:yes stop_codon:yes gene_type:complete